MTKGKPMSLATNEFSIVTINGDNVSKLGFFCRKSKMKTEGNQRKLHWLKARFNEGMRMQVAYEGKRSVGFIEYIPGEYAWRAVNAAGYMVIHCLWVVGKSKGKGYGSKLLALCEQEALEAGYKGVAMVATEGVWLAGAKLFKQHGYICVDHAPPAFELWVKQFAEASPPTFPKDWQARAARYPTGLTLFRSDQCPYIDDAVATIATTAAELGVEMQVIELSNSTAAQTLSPSVYGTFNIVYEGKLLAYHYLLKKDLIALLEQKAQ